MDPELSPGATDVPRWLVDEMLGRLTRYLRFFGHDTEYARDASDHEIARRARAEGRILVTRDRQLAASVAPAVLLRTTALDDQLREVHTRYPEFAYRPTFARCTACNGQLVPVDAAQTVRAMPGVPDGIRSSGTAIYRCLDCHHPYWEGSHTAHIRIRVAAALLAP